MRIRRWLLLGLLALLLTSLSGMVQGEAPRQAPFIRLRYAVFDPLHSEPDVPAQQKLITQANRPATYILQFTGPVQEEWKDAVERAGARLYGYIPDNAFIARMTPTVAARVRALPSVRWVGLYHPAYRLAPGLQAAGGAGRVGIAGSEVVTVTVQTLPDVDLDGLGVEIKSAGGEVLGQAANAIAGYFRVRIAADRLDDLAALDGVVWVEPYLEPHLLNDVGGGTIMRAGEIRSSLGLYGSGQIVAVADTGLDVGTTGSQMSDDFEGRIVEGQAICAYFQGGRTTWNDFDGHGTHVAGSVLGNGVYSGSDPASHDYANSFAGVAPEAQLVFQSIDHQPGGGLECVPPDLIDYLFKLAYDKGARIHTNSWGGPTGGTQQNPEYGGYTTESQQADSMMWQYRDMLILYAAGNSGVDANSDGVVDPDSIGSPGTAKNVVTVGASESLRSNGGYSAYTWGQGWPDSYPVDPIASDYMSNNANGMAAFSSRGPADDGRVKPDIVAPGTNIISARSHDPDAGTGWGVYDANYIYEGGTSMATPLTAGAAALVREWLTEVKGMSAPSAALMKAVLLNGAADMSPGQYGTGATQEISAQRPNNVTGWGRVDLVESLNPPSPRQVWFEDNTTGLSTGGTAVYTLTVGSSTSGHAVPRTIQRPTTFSAARTLPLGGGPVRLPSPPLREGKSPGYGIRPLGTTNLLQNGSFENATGSVLDYWWDNDPYETYIGQTDVDVYDGSYSAFMGGYYGADLLLWQEVSFPSDATDAVLQVYVEGLNLGSDTIQAELWIETGDPDTLVDTYTLSAVNDSWTANTWTLSTTTLNQLKGQTVYVIFRATMASTSSFYLLDLVSLSVTTGSTTPTPPPTPTPAPCPEAIADGGFEQATGDFSHPNWNVSDNARFTRGEGIARSGQNGAILGWTSSPATGDLWQAVSVPADASSATLSFWYETLGDSSFTVDVDITDSGGSNVLVHLTTLTSAGFTWQQFSHTFTSGELSAIAGQDVRLRFHISAVTDPEDLVIDDVSWQICTGGSTTGGPFRVTLAWSDYPGEPSAAKALVNDLDLEVIGPDGTHYYGNQGLYTSGQCLRESKWDACNNVEGIIIPDAPYGTYTVIVHGVNVPQGPQPFALVASGDNLQGGSAPGGQHKVYLPLVVRNR